MSTHPRGGTRQVGDGLLAAIFDATDDAIVVLDLDGKIVAWNRSAERIFGYADSEVMGEAWALLLPAHLCDEASAVVGMILAGDSVNRFETEILRRGGMPTPISLSGRPVLDPSGTVTAVCLVARDITEQQLAQATMAEVEAGIRESEALAHVGGWLWDVRTGTVQWTDEFHRMQGVDPLEFAGTFEAHVSFIHDEDRQRVCAALRGSATSGDVFDEAYRVVRNDESIRWVHDQALATIGSDGTVVGLRGVVQDVTEQRAAGAVT